MIRISQASKQASPLINIVKQGASPLFSIGVGDVHVYQVGYTPLLEWASIAKGHAAGGTLVFDYSTEAVPPVRSVLEDLEAAIPSGCRLVVMAQNVDYIEAVQARGNPKFRAVYFHSFLRTANWSYRSILADPAKIGSLMNQRRPRVPSRLYTCLLNRVRPHRLAIFGWLKKRGYLDQGNVSFHGAETFQDKARFARMIELSEQEFPSFADEVRAALDTEYPFSNFRNVEGENFIVSVNIPAFDASVSLVAESEMKATRRFTEKSLKTFMAGHRPLIAGNVGVCSLLEGIGFEFPGFGTGYDRIVSANDRLAAVLAEFESYMKMGAMERRDWIEATWPACIENMETFVDKTDAVISRSFEDLAHALESPTPPQ